MQAKSESEDKLLLFFEELKNKVEQLPANIHSNCGGEFSLTKFLNQVKAYGISIECGPADLPQTNGVAERFNGVPLEKIQCMLLQSQIPELMWHEASLHVSILLNVLPHSSLSWLSPTSVLVKKNMLI
jgi:transposase InsO family protein